jgi:glucose/arabinose dehydrogenase
LVARAVLENGREQSVKVIVGEMDGDGHLKEGNWEARPVDIRQGPDEAIYVSDDRGGRVLKIGYRH